MTTRATLEERNRHLPGDELIRDPIGSLTNAIDIAAAADRVWPWIVQMGAGTRAGWYSYDRLDNGGRPSATRMIPELQSVDVGTVFPAVPGATDAFIVAALQPRHFLVLGARAPDGSWLVTWSFVLERVDANRTRLITRARGAPGYRLHGLPRPVTSSAVAVVHSIMQRRQLLNIRRRAETLDTRGHAMTKTSSHTALKWLAGALGVAVTAYGAYVASAWSRYGQPRPPARDEADPLLDRFVPVYDVVERHSIRVGAPAEVTFGAACEADLMQSPVARAIFKGREIILGSNPDETPRPRGILALTTSIGWGVLAMVPGQEVVVGAVTRPWEANVVFRPLAADEFARFDEPGYVKIAWTLRAEPLGTTRSIFRTETRAVATDASARTRFRRYWSLLSPGIIAIRWVTLQPVKAEAERRVRNRTQTVAAAFRAR